MKKNTKKKTKKSSTATKLPAPLCKIPPLLEKRWFLMLTSAIIGAILFIAIYGARILDPTYEDWLFQGGNANNLSVIGIYPAKKSNRIFWTKHLALMRKFWTRSKPTFNDRHRLFQA